MTRDRSSAARAKRLPTAAAVTLAVAFAAAVTVARPFSGDQSLFLVGAEEMSRGAVLYRDFWDLKPPGIFDFYLIAGTVGGFSPLAIHLGELALAVLFALVLRFALARSAFFSSAANVAPLFCVALYFVVSSDFEQLQVEALASFPVFLVAWLPSEAARARGLARVALYGGAGIAVGCVLLLKLIFAPLCAALVVSALVFRNDAYAPSVRAIVLATLVVFAGAAVPTAATLLVLARGGALEVALHTWFEVPVHIITTLSGPPYSRLVEGFRWFLKMYACAILLGVVGVRAAVRSATSDPLARVFAVWIALGAATIVAQRTSWWTYQWLLLSVPVGAFASAGFATLVRSRGTSASRALLACATLLAALPACMEFTKVRDLARYAFAVRAVDREHYRIATAPYYARALRDAPLLAREDVYVIGDPTYYVVTRRRQPLVYNGWSLDLLPPTEFDAFTSELRAHGPPSVFVTDSILPDLDTINHRYPAFADYFARHYRKVRHGAFGTMYARQRVSKHTPD